MKLIPYITECFRLHWPWRDKYPNFEITVDILPDEESIRVTITAPNTSRFVFGPDKRWTYLQQAGSDDDDFTFWPETVPATRGLHRLLHFNIPENLVLPEDE